MSYLLWRAGRVRKRVLSFPELHWFLSEGCPPLGEVRIDVDHHIVNHGR